MIRLSTNEPFSEQSLDRALLTLLMRCKVWFTLKIYSWSEFISTVTVIPWNLRNSWRKRYL